MAVLVCCYDYINVLCPPVFFLCPSYGINTVPCLYLCLWSYFEFGCSCLTSTFGINVLITLHCLSYVNLLMSHDSCGVYFEIVISLILNYLLLFSYTATDHFCSYQLKPCVRLITLTFIVITFRFPLTIRNSQLFSSFLLYNTHARCL